MHMLKNHYIFNEEEPAEQERLSVLDAIITRCMSGVLPPDRPLKQNVKEVLDIGCGPGAWTIALARQYPDVHVVGIDISENMIRYAQAQARVRRIFNVSFQVMDVRDMPFADNQFDFINARFISVAMTKNDWPALWQRCYEILAPGGWVRWSESDIPTTTSAAYDQCYILLARAMRQMGQSFSVTGHTIGLLPHMIPLLMKAGFTNFEERAYALDSSYYTQLWQEGLEVSIATLQLIKPLLIHTGVINERDFKTLFDEAVTEMQNPSYVAMSLMLSILVQKPTKG